MGRRQEGQQRSLSTRHLHETHLFSWALVQPTCHHFAMVYCKLCWPYQVEQFLAVLRPLKWLGNAPESRLQMEVSLGVCFNKQGWGYAFLQTLYLQAESIHPREKIPWAPPLSNFMVHVAGILRSSSERRRGRTLHHRPFKWGETRYPAMSESTSPLSTFSPYRVRKFPSL